MNQVTVIVMITKLVEDKKRKAHQYWPDDGDGEESLGLVFELGGGIRVEHLSSSFQGSYFIRRFCIQLQDGSQREVVQLHTEMWPDLTAPDEPRSFIIILSPVLNSEKMLLFNLFLMELQGYFWTLSSNLLIFRRQMR